jgi:excinuclease ABC subunit C
VLVWEQTADEFSALLRELELIQRLCPRFNVQGRPGHQRYHYLCVGKQPAPYVYVSKSPGGKDTASYGPLTSWSRSEEAARRLNDWFKLRDCPQTVPMAFADQAELFPLERAPKCLRFEIGTCGGPCVGACSRKEYGDGVRAVKAFLDGRDKGLLRTITGLMEEAATRFEFEKASALRDRLTVLEWLNDWLSLLRKARNLNSFVYPLADADGQERWYLIHRGQVRAVIPAPQSPADRERAAALVRSTFADPPSPAVLTGGTVDSVLLVVAWFKKRPEEKAKLLSKAAALGRCAAAG